MKKALCLLLLLTAAVTLASCGATRYDNEENAALYAESGLSELENTYDYAYGSVSGSWVAVRYNMGEDNAHVIGCSEEELTAETLENIAVLVVCTSHNSSAQYESTATGTTTSISSEKVTISYYDTLNRTCYGAETIYKELPKKTTSTVGYKVSNSEIISAVKKRIASGVCPIHDTDFFKISKKGVLQDTNGSYDSEIVVIPDSVTEIATGFSPEVGVLRMYDKAEVYVPDSVAIIPPNTFGCSAVLVVGHNSYAERYAIENGHYYRYIDEAEIYSPFEDD